MLPTRACQAVGQGGPGARGGAAHPLFLQPQVSEAAPVPSSPDPSSGCLARQLLGGIHLCPEPSGWPSAERSPYTWTPCSGADHEGTPTRPAASASGAFPVGRGHAPQSHSEWGSEPWSPVSRLADPLVASERPLASGSFPPCLQIFLEGASLAQRPFLRLHLQTVQMGYFN